MPDEIDVSDEADSPEVMRPTLLVRSMQVSDLFGSYTYTIRVADSAAPPVILLYGDNGSGKTTILNMLWNLLSPASNKNHRGKLSRTPFRLFSVTLSNGDTILTRKIEGLTGNFEITVSRGKEVIVYQPYLVDSQGRVAISQLVKETVILSKEDDDESAETVEIARETAEPLSNDDAYANYLRNINLDPYFLADNRRIYNDRFDAESRTPAELTYEEVMRERLRRDHERSSLASELSQAVRRANTWIRQQVLSGTAQGSQGADAIYLQVLSQLAGTAHVVNAHPSLDEVSKRLADLDARSRQFSEFGLVPIFRAAPFMELLDAADPSRASIIDGVLTPYLDGQRARLDSLQPTESVIRTFVETVNSFLVNKRVIYNLRHGLRILTADSEILIPEQLSSGERQLLLLLCNALFSRTESALFIIDEPEISLNAKWQRKLIPALLGLVQSSNVQFILATHSVEIITGHREYLAQLRNQKRKAVR